MGCLVSVFGRPFVQWFALCYRIVVSPVCNVGVLGLNGWTDHHETWRAGRHWTWPHCVRWGPSSASPERRQTPQFLAHVYCSQTAAGIKMPLGVEVDLVLGQLPSPKRGHSPQFSAYVCCGQTAAWIKMPLGMELGLGPGHIVRDGDSVPLSKNGGCSPQFSAHVYCGQTAGWIKMPLGTMVGLSLGNIVLDVDSAPPARAPPPCKLQPLSVVAKRLHGSRCHLVRT